MTLRRSLERSCSCTPGRIDGCLLAAEPAAQAGVDMRPLEQLAEPLGFLREQLFDSLAQVASRVGGKFSDRLVTEDGLEELLAQHPSTGGDPYLRAGQASGVRENDDHDEYADTVDAEGEKAGGRPLGRSHAADQIEHVALPSADLTGCAFTQVGACPPGLDPVHGQQCTAGGAGSPRLDRSLGGFVSSRPDQRFHPGLQGDLKIRGGTRFPAYSRTEAIADPADVALQ